MNWEGFPREAPESLKNFFKKNGSALVIAELGGRIAGYGGILLEAPNVAVLCYGIIDPEFQGHRIGTTLTLLRITLIEPQPSGIFVLIFAVDASLPFYRRFGFADWTKWKYEDGKEIRVAIVNIPGWASRKVKSKLHQRGIHVQGNMKPGPSGNVSCSIKKTSRGKFQIEFGPISRDKSVIDNP